MHRRRLYPLTPSGLVIGPLLLVTGVAASQERLPKRPGLPAGADTNNAQAYYYAGVQRLSRPTEAANAFFWASRLDPTWAAPLYGRRVALLLANPNRLVGYLERDKGVLRSAETLRMDSLALRALHLDPFLHRDLDREIISVYLTESALRDMRRHYNPGEVERARPEIEHWINSYLNSARGVQWSGWRAYSDRRFPEALKHFATALKDARDKDRLYTQRGQIFYLMEMYDSAQAQLAEAIESARERDEEDLVVLYESKAMLEYSLGMALEASGDQAAARDAYARALAEDLAFYPAHLRLGSLALTAGDTLTALSEFELAVQIDATAVIANMVLGRARYLTGDYDDAVTAFERTIALEPFYAEPYLMLGVSLEKLGDKNGALTQYRNFAARIHARDERRTWTERRITALSQP